MEVNSKASEHVEDEEEYILLDLDGVCGQIDIPPNASYVLSDLDTLNPVLVIGDNLKLVVDPGSSANMPDVRHKTGEYEETIGTCFVFSESDAAPVVHEETGPSEANLFMGKCIVDPNQAPAKQVKPIAGLHKILKFRLPSEVDTPAPTVKPTDSNL